MTANVDGKQEPMNQEALQAEDHPSASQRVFVAPSVTAAMYALRRELGDNAVILQVRRRGGEENLVEVIASESSDVNTVAEVVSPSGGDADILKRLGLMLEKNFTPSLQARLLHAAEYLLEENTHLNDITLLAELIKREIVLLDFNNEAHPALPIILFGPAGVGKTSAAMKFALQFHLMKEPSRIINLDTKRSGNRYTLSNFAKLIDTKVHHLRAQAAQKKLFTAPAQFDLVDTPPLNPYQPEEVETIFEEFKSHSAYRVLVLSAAYDYANMRRIVDMFSRHVSIDGLILTQLDIAKSDAKVINFVLETGIPLVGLSDSPEITTPLMCEFAQEWAERLISDEHQSAKVS